MLFRSVGENLGGAADDRRVGVDMAVAGDHADITKARLIRDSVVVAPDLEIASLRREKDDVTEVRDGYECGITLGHKDIQVGDIIETWEMREKPRD